ncbi:iron-containing alcohol dehydrogenase [Defluviitalea saccharophila]|uniref:Iron-containing alcohol dehydrogenase n=1 Tax=Defluviitalea saccharophila TaxID=879970 RepID=A0ABZ2Y6D0_9FIRM|nr:iron-containing alcohol dehydrogenase [Candidatus Epulonipiscium sp.]
MDNFVFQNPTKIIFGKAMETRVGEEVSKYSKKILLHYGGGSIKKTGLYDRVISSLKAAGIEFIELPGVKPNPRLSLVREGIKICRENNIDFILAVGGGSVIDSAKAIALGVVYDGDVWDFYTGKASPKAALPIGTILTIPAAGSESSTGSVITNEDGWYKRSAGSTLLYPKFSILNPELAFTLPKYQVACGAADILAHLMERYFTNTQSVELIDRMIESTMKTVIKYVPMVLEDSNNYEAWAQVMWAGTLAHNNLLNTGRVGDWGSHDIEHEISGIYDVAHGAGLAVVFPAWMKYVYKHDPNRFVQFAVRVWNVEQDFFDPEKTILQGIQKLEEFFTSIGLPTRLEGLGITDDRLEEMADKGTDSDQKTLGNFVKLRKNDIYNILKLAQK